MVRSRGWQWRAVAVAIATAGCQSTATVPISPTEVPPTVRAAFEEEQPGATVVRATRNASGDHRFFIVTYRFGDGPERWVMYNVVGDEIDRR